MPTARPSSGDISKTTARDSEKSEAEKIQRFYNIFQPYIQQPVGNTWKVNEKEREGYGKKVSFWVHMNNTDDDLFLLGAFGSEYPSQSTCRVPPPRTRKPSP